MMRFSINAAGDVMDGVPRAKRPRGARGLAPCADFDGVDEAKSDDDDGDAAAAQPSAARRTETPGDASASLSMVEGAPQARDSRRIKRPRRFEGLGSVDARRKLYDLQACMLFEMSVLGCVWNIVLLLEMRVCTVRWIACRRLGVL